MSTDFDVEEVEKEVSEIIRGVRLVKLNLAGNEIPWLDCFKAFHAYLTCREADENALSLWLLFAQEAADPLVAGEEKMKVILDKYLACDKNPPEKIDYRTIDFDAIKAAALDIDRDEFRATFKRQVFKSKYADEDQEEEDESSAVSIDDDRFIKWYSDERNLITAQKVFCFLSMVLTRGCVEDSHDMYKELQFRVYPMVQKFINVENKNELPSAYFLIDEVLVDKFVAQIQQNEKFNRALVKYWLYTYHSIEDDYSGNYCDTRVRFSLDSIKSYVIVDLFQCYKMDYYVAWANFGTSGGCNCGPIDLEKFQRFVTLSEHHNVEDEFDNFRALNDLFRSLELSNLSLTRKFWRYARFFNDECLLEVDIERNMDSFAYVCGLLKVNNCLEQRWEVLCRGLGEYEIGQRVMKEYSGRNSEKM